MTIKAQDVKALREKTGLGMMECKKALQEADGNLDDAIKNLRKSSALKAEKKASRTAVEGLILSKLSDKEIIFVEVNCETDFVAKDENFVSFCNETLNTAIKHSSKKDLLDEVSKSKYISYKYNTEISKINNEDLNKSFIETNNLNLYFKMLVAADGRFSRTRYHANIKYYFHDYQQTAFVFNISHSDKHQGIALERFFPTGPLTIPF